uniref:50S ribosomal protein L35 n=1 Tax=Ptilothamnion sphaericum TaxID=1498216 RepID=A0A4D6WZ26_9FLOR|nr:ribosomal protein L35 [Ptilothamnion sphaericum]
MLNFKLKTVKSISKRFKLTSKGKLLKHKSSRSHLLNKKTSNRKRQLRKVSIVNIRDRQNFINGMPYLY